MTNDEIRLVVPAEPGWARLARLTGAGLASRLGFEYDDVEDVRIALGEACSLLVDGGGDEPHLEISFRVTEDTLRVTVRRGDPVDPADAGGTVLSHQILEAVTDSVEMGPGHVSFTKRRTASGT